MSKNNSPKDQNFMRSFAKSLLWILGISTAYIGWKVIQLEEEVEQKRQAYKDALLLAYQTQITSFEMYPDYLSVYDQKASAGKMNQADCHMPDLLMEDIEMEKKALKAKRETLSVFKVVSDSRLTEFEQREEKAYSAINLRVGSIKLLCDRLFSVPPQPQEQDYPQDPLFFPQMQEKPLPYKID